MSDTNGSSSPDMDTNPGRQLHQPARQFQHAKTMSSSSTRASSMSAHGCSSSSSANTRTAALPPRPVSYSIERHLRAMDDPINARMHDPRRWKGQPFTASPPGASRPSYFPRIVGGWSSDHDTVSEQDLLLAEVGATLKG